MYQELEDNIDVIVLFERCKLIPCRFRWKGRIHKVERVTGDWVTESGDAKLWHFAVVDSISNYFQLCYDERNVRWLLTKVWVE